MRSSLSLLAVFCLCAPSLAQEETVFKNAGLSRTVSAAAQIIKTSKLEAGGQMLDGPSVEFMLEIELKGARITLVPSDFDIKETSELTRNREVETSVRLDSHYDGLPITIYLNYFREPKNAYMQKSITVSPCKAAAGSVLKLVVIDDMRLREQFVPCAPIDRIAGGENGIVFDLANLGERFAFDRDSSFAAIDRKSNRGLFFLVASPRGREMFTTRRSLVLSEEMDAPLEKGFETARATIGAVNGPPEVLYKRFRDFIWNNCCAARRETNGESTVYAASEQDAPASVVHRLGAMALIRFASDANCDCLQARRRLFNEGFALPCRVVAPNGCAPKPGLDSLKQRFPQFFGTYQQVLAFPDGQNVDGEAHIMDNKGFIVLHNPSDKPQRVAIPLNEPGLELKGALKLADWTQPDTPSSLGTARPDDKVEVEIPAGSVKFIGINIEP